MDIFIKTTPAFDKNAKKLLSSEALEEFYDYIGHNPEQGKIIPETSGIRKIRWKPGFNDKGKSGGVRILYHYSDDILILLITLYGKNNQENITDSEKNQLKKTIPLLVAKYRGEL